MATTERTLNWARLLKFATKDTERRCDWLVFQGRDFKTAWELYASQAWRLGNLLTVANLEDCR